MFRLLIQSVLVFDLRTFLKTFDASLVCCLRFMAFASARLGYTQHRRDMKWIKLTYKFNLNQWLNLFFKEPQQQQEELSSFTYDEAKGVTVKSPANSLVFWRGWNFFWTTPKNARHFWAFSRVPAAWIFGRGYQGTALTGGPLDVLLVLSSLVLSFLFSLYVCVHVCIRTYVHMYVRTDEECFVFSC